MVSIIVANTVFHQGRITTDEAEGPFDHSQSKGRDDPHRQMNGESWMNECPAMIDTTVYRLDKRLGQC